MGMQLTEREGVGRESVREKVGWVCIIWKKKNIIEK